MKVDSTRDFISVCPAGGSHLVHIYVVNEEQEKDAEQALESPIRSHGCSTRTSTVHRSKSGIVRMPYRERKKR